MRKRWLELLGVGVLAAVLAAAIDVGLRVQSTALASARPGVLPVSSKPALQQAPPGTQSHAARERVVEPLTMRQDGAGFYRPDELIVAFRPSTSPARQLAVHAQMRTTVAAGQPAIGVYRLQIESDTPVHEVVARYRALDGVAYAEPNYIVHTAGVPDDPLFSEQWALHNSGQTSGTLDADIDAVEAWDVERGDPDVLIAIVDSGIDYTHPDLGGGIGPTYKIITGYDFVNDDDDPQDDQGHGTHVAGIAAAGTGNGVGIAGVAPDSRLIAVKVLSSDGSGSSYDVAAGIVYAVDQGAQVINLSLGSIFESQVIESALAYAHAQGVAVVCAAGNGGTGRLIYPAAYDSYCLAVAATDHNDQRTPWSNYGPEMDVAAPGARILSTLPANAYDYRSGTSMATPHVAGILALLRAYRPDLSVEQLYSRVRRTADDVNGGGEDPYLGTGRVNAYAALTAAPAPDIRVAPDAIHSIMLDSQATQTHALSLHNVGETPLTFTVSTTATWLQAVPAAGSVSADGQQTVTLTITTAGLALGVYHTQVVVSSNDADTTVFSVPLTLEIVEHCRVRINADPVDYTSLQPAIDAAQPGDLLKIAGYCTDPRPTLEWLAWITQTLVLQGGYTSTDWENPDSAAHPAILDAERRHGGVIGIRGPASVTLEGLRITGGAWNGGVGVTEAQVSMWNDTVYSNQNVAGGGGVWLSSASHSVISGCTVANNVSYDSSGSYERWWGGGIHVDHSADILLQNNMVIENEASAGGGVWGYQVGMTARGNTILRNTAIDVGGLGIMDGYTAGTLLVANTVEGNQASTCGGMCLYGMSEMNIYAQVLSNTLRGNVSSWGGGMVAMDALAGLFSGNVFSNNVSQNGAGLLLFESRDITVHNNRFDGNSAARQGGGLTVMGGQGLRVTGNTVLGNTAPEGGGLWWAWGSGSLDGNTFRNNQADRGGAVWLDASDTEQILLVNNSLAGNRAEQGAGLFLDNHPLWQWADVRLLHTTLAAGEEDGSSAINVHHGALALTNTLLSGYAVGIRASGGTTVEVDGVLWDAVSLPVSQAPTATVSLQGERWGDAAFVDPAAGDYHIGSTSAARDAGVDAGVRQDADGQTRPMDQGYDLGADEYAGAGLALSLTPAPPFANRGSQVTYTIGLSAAGSLPVSGVVLTNALPLDQRAVAVTVSTGSCDLGHGAWGGAVRCGLGSLAPGTTVTVVLTAQVSPAVTLTQAMIDRVQVVAVETANTAQATTYAQDCYAQVEGEGLLHTSVQPAVDAAGPGAVVKIAGFCVGTFAHGSERQQVYLDKPLTLRGGYTLTNWTVSFPATQPTTLHALGQGRVILIGGDANPTLERLTITGGDAMAFGGAWDGPRGCGGGVLAYRSGLVLRESQVVENRALNGGGLGAQLATGPVQLEQNVFAHNLALAHGGGVDIRYVDQPVTLLRNTLIQNEASDPDSPYVGKGGGANVSGGHVTLQWNTVLSNTAPEVAGLSLSGAEIVLEDNQIQGNQGVGARIYGTSIQASRNQVVGNTATGLWLDSSASAAVYSNSVRANGGGVSLNYVDGIVADNLVEYNQGWVGGGFRLQGGQPLLRHNVIRGNSAAWGGGIYTWYSDPTLDGNLILDNVANSSRSSAGGGGAYLGFGQPVLINNVLAGNRSLYLPGDGLYVFGLEARLVHNTIVGAPGGSGSGIYVSNVHGTHSSVSLTNTILVSHTLGVYAAEGCTATLEGTLWYANASDWSATGSVDVGALNLWADPAFADPGAGDYHLRPGSAAIDAGTPVALAIDLDGDPRPLDGNQDGLDVFDLGADEYDPNAYTPVAAQFTATPTTGSAPLTVTFSNTSSGDFTTCAWTFGDGSTSTACAPPAHTYSIPGVYTVTLSVSGLGGSDTESKTNYITATHAPPVADFTATPLTSHAPLTVVFTDTSTGAITAWAWTFGDGTTSTAQHPTHEYTVPGTYTVTLTVTGPGGSDTETKAGYVIVTETPDDQHSIYLPLVLRSQPDAAPGTGAAPPRRTGFPNQLQVLVSLQEDRQSSTDDRVIFHSQHTNRGR